MTTSLTPTGGTGVNTLLVLVNRVHDELGIERYNTLSGPDHLALTTINGLNDAVEDLWYKQAWPWQTIRHPLRLEAGTYEYPLPERFMKLTTDVRLKTSTLTELTPKEWAKLVPTHVTNPAPTPGTPVYVCIDGTDFLVWPPPSQDFLDNVTRDAYFHYRLKPPDRLNGDDNEDDPFDVPAEYVEALVEFAKWKTGTKLGMGDAAAFRARYDEIITNRIRVMKKLTRRAERQSHMTDGGQEDVW
jgi:hypothetical protein